MGQEIIKSWRTAGGRTPASLDKIKILAQFFGRSMQCFLMEAEKKIEISDESWLTGQISPEDEVIQLIIAYSEYAPIEFMEVIPTTTRNIRDYYFLNSDGFFRPSAYHFHGKNWDVFLRVAPMFLITEKLIEIFGLEEYSGIYGCEKEMEERYYDKLSAGAILTYYSYPWR